MRYILKLIPYNKNFEGVQNHYRQLTLNSTNGAWSRHGAPSAAEMMEEAWKSGR